MIKTIKMIRGERQPIQMGPGGPMLWIENGEPFDVDPSITLTPIGENTFRADWQVGRENWSQQFQIVTIEK